MAQKPVAGLHMPISGDEMGKSKKLMTALANVADGASNILTAFILKHNPNADVEALRSGILELGANVLTDTKVSVIASSEARGLTEYCQAADAIAVAHSIYKSGDKATGIKMLVDAFALPDCDELMIALAEINDEATGLMDAEEVGAETNDPEDITNPGSTITSAYSGEEDGWNDDDSDSIGAGDDGETPMGEPTDTDPEADPDSDPEIEGIIAAALHEQDSDGTSDGGDDPNVTASEDEEDSDGTPITAEDALYNEPDAGETGVVGDDEELFDSMPISGDGFENIDPLESIFSSTDDPEVIAAANKLSMSGSAADRKRAGTLVKAMQRRAA